MEEIDTLAFGVSRLRLLRELAAGSRAKIVKVGAQATAFGMIRPGASAAYLGPVCARDSIPAKAIILDLLNSVHPGPVYWDIPDDNLPSVQLAKELGFVEQRPLVRMVRGENQTPGNRFIQFAIAGPEVG